MNRRQFIQTTALAAMPGLSNALADSTNRARPAPRSVSARHFEWDEATLAQLQAAMSSRRESAVSLLKKYVARIDDIDQRGPALKSVIELNPDAVSIARALDVERQAKGPRGPLHGVPVLLKDNIDTADRMMTTAGSLALVGPSPVRDSFVARRLREAGAVIVGKTNLSEWANFRSSRSTSGWSGRGGLTKNPYVLDRNPSGSSSGSAVAVAANLCSVAVGTETDGSIISPSSFNGIVGIKPTLGLISRAGIIPIAHSQDTAGPMARTVTDAAILLGALAGADTDDPVTQVGADKSHNDFRQFLDANGLKGARIGVARKYFPSDATGARAMDTALEAMKVCGGILIDLSDGFPPDDMWPAEEQVLLYEFKTDLNAYLANRGTTRVKTLKEVIEFNVQNKEAEMPYFGQELFLKAEEKGSLTEKAYLDSLEKCRRLSRHEGIDSVMERHRLDAIVAPSGGPAHRTDLVHGDRDTGGSSSPAAVAGYPSITVPAATVFGLPMGISFFGRVWSESTLIRLAFAFEQATRFRRLPQFLATVA